MKERMVAAWVVLMAALWGAVPPQKTPTPPPHKPDDIQYINIEIRRDELNNLKRQCFQQRPIPGTYVRIDYPNGEYVILPCSAIIDKEKTNGNNNTSIR